MSLDMREKENTRVVNNQRISRGLKIERLFSFDLIHRQVSHYTTFQSDVYNGVSRRTINTS